MALIVQVTFAQQKTVSGTVSDENGLPLIGTTVVISGTSSGTTTDFDGKYLLNVSQGDVLNFSYVGYSDQNITVGASNTIDATLQPDNTLDEVVVTALGIQKQKRTVGYASEIVKGEELTNARESNIANSFQGKVTGVQVTQSSGNLGSSSRVIIRGVSSLSGSNQPIWVVDGVIINNNQSVSNSTRISGNRDFANGASVINPDDVESINILKGAAATALYGSRAAGGVIIVTSKKGRTNENGSATVSFSSSIRFDDLFRIPDYQQDYAMGTNGKYSAGSNGFDWGPRIVGQIVPNLPVTGESGPLTAVKDNGIGNFFKTGLTRINNFSISDANDKTDYRLSLTSLNQEGIIPGANLDRITTSFNAGVKHNPKLESRFGLQYIKTTSEGTAAAGANDPNIIGLSFFSSTLDPNLFSVWKDELGNQTNHIVSDNGNLANNPLWLRNENSNDRDEDRIIGNYSLTFKPIPELSLTARMGLDLQDDKRFIENSKGTIARLEGDFNSDNIRNQELTVDFIANYNKEFNSDFTLNIIAGSQYNSRLFERQRISDRWKMGEDATAFGGAIRDMWNPNCNGDPGSTTDSNYNCDYALNDNGGVHTNSGIPNHLYALLVDGGTYNGETISALGFTKAAHIFWRAQSEYLSASSDFTVFADAIEASCSDLIGTNLEGLSTTATAAGLSGEIISNADLTNVNNALIAVTLRTDNSCVFTTVLDSDTTAICAAAASNPIFNEDWESGIGSWTVTQLPVNSSTWEAREWNIVTDLPQSRSGSSMYAPNPVNGNCTTDLENGVIRLETPTITIPNYTNGIFELAFNHSMSSEEDFDGGNLKFSIDGGNWAIIPTTAFTQNAYNLTLNNTNNDSPLMGEAAFSGTDVGSFDSVWGQSVVDLSSIGVVANSSLRLRWEFGSDGCNGVDGWYVDEVVVYNCSEVLAIADINNLDDIISIYPNPSEGIFNLKLKNLSNFTFDLYDITGKNIMNKIPINKNDFTIDLNQLQKGLYFIKLQSEIGTITKKLILQ